MANDAPGQILVSRRSLATWVLRATAALSFAIPLVWMFSEGLPTSGAIFYLVSFTAPVWIWALFAISTAKRLEHNDSHVTALVLLSMWLIVTWVIAWESQIFEPEMRIRDRGFVVGIRPPASWNEGRWAFALLALVAAFGIGSLLLAAWRHIPSSTRKASIIVLALTTAVLGVSVPVLQARERARAEHARAACTAFLKAKKSDPTEVRGRCSFPYDEPFFMTSG